MEYITRNKPLSQKKGTTIIAIYLVGQPLFFYIVGRAFNFKQ